MRQMAIFDSGACHGCDALETSKRHNRLETDVARVLHMNVVEALLDGYGHLDSDLKGAAEVREVVRTRVERIREIQSMQMNKYWTRLGLTWASQLMIS